MKRYVAISFLLFAVSCDTTNAPPGQPALHISVEDVSCTEAWIQVSLDAEAQPRTVQVRRDTQTVYNFTLANAETLLLDEGLLPNQTYTYQAFRPITSLVTDQSSPVQATTLNTTSHNFTWRVDTIGEGGSVLYDVTIINDTLAYAVGAIYLLDSLGNWDPNAYNLVKWNGARWELLRIQFSTFCGQTGTGSYPAKSIFAFSATDIWIGMDGSQVVRWNGVSQSAPICTPVSINKLWGQNSSSLYAVGNNGGIAHYTSGSWHRMESGTTVELNDAWGGSNQLVGDSVVLVTASNKFSLGEKKLLRIHSDGLVDSLPWPMQDRRIHSVWFDKDSRVYTTGGGVFEYRGGSSWREITAIPPIYTDRIRGDAPNNIFVVGDFGIAAHFNGVSWMTYPELSIPQGVYQSVAVRGRMIMIVSTTGTVVTGMQG